MFIVPLKSGPHRLCMTKTLKLIAFYEEIHSCPFPLCQVASTVQKISKFTTFPPHIRTPRELYLNGLQMMQCITTRLVCVAFRPLIHNNSTFEFALGVSLRVPFWVQKKNVMCWNEWTAWIKEAKSITECFGGEWGCTIWSSLPWNQFSNSQTYHRAPVLSLSKCIFIYLFLISVSLCGHFH